MVRILFVILLFSAPAYSFEDKGMNLFNKALDNVRQYQLEKTMTSPFDAIDQALMEFKNEKESQKDAGLVLPGK